MCPAVSNTTEKSEYYEDKELYCNWREIPNSTGFQSSSSHWVIRVFLIPAFIFRHRHLITNLDKRFANKFRKERSSLAEKTVHMCFLSTATPTYCNFRSTSVCYLYDMEITGLISCGWFSRVTRYFLAYWCKHWWTAFAGEKQRNGMCSGFAAGALLRMCWVAICIASHVLDCHQKLVWQ